MKLPLASWVVVFGMVGGCTEVPTTQDLGELEAADRWYLDHESIPGGGGVAERTQGHDWPTPSEDAPEADPADAADDSGMPMIRVGRLRSDNEDSETATCSFSVRATGFPAIRADGDLVVTFTRDIPSASDGEDEFMTVAWLGTQPHVGNEALTVFDGNEVPLGEFSNNPVRCKDLRRIAIRNARAVNEKLQSHRWRSLDELDVVVIEDSANHGFDPESEDVRPAATRPVEFLWMHGDAIFRVPRVKVLAREPTDWTFRDEYCDTRAHILTVWGDREAGVALVSFDHNSGACFCESPTRMDLINVPELVFAAIERRPVELPDDED